MNNIGAFNLIIFKFNCKCNEKIYLLYLFFQIQLYHTIVYKMEDSAQNESCILCNEILEPPFRVVHEKGIKSLIKASHQRKDMKHLQLQQLKSINVHEKCAKTYSSDRVIQTYLKLKNSDSLPVSTRRNSNDYEFKFHELCLFCTEDASDEFILKQCTVRSAKRRYVTCVTGEKFRSNLLEVTKGRTDKFSRDVLSRIMRVENLSDVCARYHRDCAQKFFTNMSREPLHLSERTAAKAAKFIYEYICEHSDQCQFSIYDILQNFEANEWPTRKVLFKHLYNIFENEIIIHNSKDGPILSYRNMGKKLLSEHWYKEKEGDTEIERQRIVRTAAKIILEDIRSKVYNFKSYPAPHCFLENIETDIPASLKVFLYELIVKNKQNGEKWEKKQFLLLTVYYQQLDRGVFCHRCK